MFPLLFVAPMGHTSASVIPLIKVGRGMYSVVHKDSGVTCFLVCQISSVEGSKYIKIRSPFQVPLTESHVYSGKLLQKNPVFLMSFPGKSNLKLLYYTAILHTASGTWLIHID